MGKLNNIKDFILKYKDCIYFFFILVLLVLIINKSNSNKELKDEIKRQYNNELALKDTISSYIDELGRTNAEKHAYQLTQKELLDSIDLIKKKHFEYISYINSKIGVRDTMFVETFIERNIRDISEFDKGFIRIDTADVFGKSYRRLDIAIPYHIDSVLHVDNSRFVLEQDIFVESWIERNDKTGETFVHLRSDYPGISFNSGTGIVVEPSRSFNRDMRKRNGIGLFVGPTVGLGYTNIGIKPYFGLSLGIGYTFTPKWAQW